MNKEHSLEEDIRHGTKEHPLVVLRFISGLSASYPNGFFVQRHWHHSIEILRIRKGSYTVELNLEDLALKEGDLCMVNSEELHQITGNETNTCHDALIFDPQILDFSYPDEFQQDLTGPLASRENSLVHVIRPGMEGHGPLSELFDQIMEAGLGGEKGWYYEAKLCLLGMLNQIRKYRLTIPSASMQSAADKEKIDRYKRVISYMEENYMKKVSLQQLADAAQCNPQYLCHFFKEIAGMPPVKYLISYRVGRAKEFLENSTKTVLEVSLDCGFDNVSYFIRQFRRETGMTPREYRRASVRKMGKGERDAV